MVIPIRARVMQPLQDFVVPFMERICDKVDIIFLFNCIELTAVL